MSELDGPDYLTLKKQIALWAEELGFDAIGVSDIELSEDHQFLRSWLEKKYHATMAYMGNHLELRRYPEKLVPNTIRIISARMQYLSSSIAQSQSVLKDNQTAYISRYALGRDYHKLMRKRLAKLAEKIRQLHPELHYRVFADSAPVLEKPIANKAGLGWIGKHSLVLDETAGSFFFIGEIFTNLNLPVDELQTNSCGQCRACREICPTDAIVADKVVDSSRCISYLTIENKGPIPEPLRAAVGNRIFGCDDCQLFCPWNRFAQLTTETDFQPRHGLQDASLLELFSWSESTYLKNTAGSALRRAGYLGWRRNLAVALGNANYHPDILSALQSSDRENSELLEEHISWAIHQQFLKKEN
ncbi:MAG TPA: tRNA epoxyqueuosine(34) reductase QueG [Gammaproteobacteria bacterium]|nr:tRNA epoxyqueuosine(34) reductase QueG [Gammaproteobacteria bacterium]